MSSLVYFHRVILFIIIFIKFNIIQQQIFQYSMTSDDELSRIGVSLPKNLLDQFDEILDFRQYASRSEGIRDAIRTYTINNQWLSDNNTRRRGVITMVYGYTDDNLLAAITEIRLGNNEIIRVSLQTPVSENRRLEVLLVEGDSTQLRALAERLAGQKGVGAVKVTTIPAGDKRENDLGKVGPDTGLQHPGGDMP